MQTKPLLAGLGLSLLLAGCSTLSDGQTVAEYCSDPERAGEGLCQLKVDINGVETQLSQTNLSVSEARRLAESAAEAAAAAQASADAAQGSADRAMSVANQALSMSDLSCETRVLNQTDTGTCRDGYTLMGCSQTRYTYRAGGLLSCAKSMMSSAGSTARFWKCMCAAARQAPDFRRMTPRSWTPTLRVRTMKGPSSDALRDNSLPALVFMSDRCAGRLS